MVGSLSPCVAGCVTPKVPMEGPDKSFISHPTPRKNLSYWQTPWTRNLLFQKSWIYQCFLKLNCLHLYEFRFLIKIWHILTKENVYSTMSNQKNGNCPKSLNGTKSTHQHSDSLSCHWFKTPQTMTSIYSKKKKKKG